MKPHVLDANALYRFLTGGPGSDVVGRLFLEARDAEEWLHMSVINWGEVYYSIARKRGFDETDKVMSRARLLPLAIVTADELVTTRAARLKASHGLPYADCFAAAIAGEDGVVVTSDAKDFRKVPGLHILALPEHRP